MEEHRQLTVDLKHLYVLDLKFDKKKKYPVMWQQFVC